jgi:membrane-bound lytic murein transglycosylase D
MKYFFVFMVTLLLVVCVSPLSAQTEKSYGKQQTLEKRISQLEEEVDGLKRDVSFLRMPPAPETLILCGKPVPLIREDVRERFEREFYQFLENRGLLTIIIKRYAKFFSIVSDEINKANMPVDLIFLAMAESYLDPRVNSVANAGGLWQFMRETGKKEGLCVSDCIDERYSVTRSTKAALSYLRKLYDEFGDWLNAMAAYNSGETRMREAIANEYTQDFFDLIINPETDRYVLRIAALKEIVGNPEKYGLAVSKRDYYQPYSVVEFAVEAEKEVHTAVFAQAMELPYRTFREYNLHMRRYKLPAGVFRVYVPVEKKQTFMTKIKEVAGISILKEE